MVILPADRPSMDYSTRWLNQERQMGLIIPSAILPLEPNLLVNPRHPSVSAIQVVDVFDFGYDPRMSNSRS